MMLTQHEFFEYFLFKHNCWFEDTFFLNMIADLKISDCNNCDPFVEKIQEPICEPKEVV